ncbi:MAG: S1 RNA-binding domain-containing protein [Bacteroidia bacterium]
MKVNLTDNQLRFFKTLKVGEKVEGKVIKITRFGVFIRYRVLNGLLHINDITYGRMTEIEDFVKLNQKINVMIIKIDEENHQLQFGLKQMEEEPWKLRINKYKEGDTVVGSVVAILDYGAFLSIAPGIEGLLHVSELPDFNPKTSTKDYFHIDDVFQVTIIKLDVAAKKLSFSLK